MTNILRDILIQLSDINRRLANVVRYCALTEVDAANAIAKVTFGGGGDGKRMVADAGVPRRRRSCLVSRRRR